MLALLFTSFNAAAETAPLTEEELAELADLAIVGEVVASQCDSIAETESAIVRTYTAEIEIIEVLVGDISVDEAKKILTEGKSDLIEDFTSKRGKPFPAYLVLEAKKVGFEFPPRAPPADATKFPVVEGIVGMCPKHNVGIIETETHYQAEENTEGCKISVLREVSKRTITREEAKTMVENRKIGPFDDFTSKAGKPFSASLYLKGDENVGYRFAKR